VDPTKSMTVHQTVLLDMVGRVLGGGKYRVLDMIGQGGMATVYRAQQLNIPRQVAIKMARPDMASQPDFVKRFRQEIAAVGRLGLEPHILPVYDVGEEDVSLLYMVMPYLTGGTLADRLQARPDQAWALCEALNVAEQTLVALDYAHAQGFVHRDVKPSN